MSGSDTDHRATVRDRRARQIQVEGVTKDSVSGSGVLSGIIIHGDLYVMRRVQNNWKVGYLANDLHGLVHVSIHRIIVSSTLTVARSQVIDGLNPTLTILKIMGEMLKWIKGYLRGFSTEGALNERGPLKATYHEDISLRTVRRNNLNKKQ